MRDPIRLRDDPAAAAELRSLLGYVARSKSLDPMTRVRIGRRLSRFLALPLVLTVGLTMKTAAASLAIATGTIVVGVVVVHEVRVLRTLAVPLPGTANAPTQKRPFLSQSSTERPQAGENVVNRPPVVTASVAAFPDEVAGESAVTVRTKEPSRVATRGVSPGPTIEPTATAKSIRGDGLEQEAAMLETARRALAGSPGEALAIVEEHRVRFPQATLALEREMIRLDALYRLGRHTEARRIAESMRQRGGLYAERVERFIEKLDAPQH